MVNKNQLPLIHKIMTLHKFTIIAYILIGYLASILITFSFFIKDAEQDFKDHPEHFYPFTPKFLATIVAILPVYNIYVLISLKIRNIHYKRSMKKLAGKLEDKFKDHSDPEVREKVKEITQDMRNL